MKIFDLVQLIAAIAIVIGLALVIFELQQTRSLARAQLFGEHFAEAIENKRALLGENPAPILTKSCADPAGLTPDEREVALAALDINFLMTERARTIEEVVGLDIPWELAARTYLRAILSSPIGRYDYETFKDARWPVEYEAIITEILAAGDLDCDYFWQDFDAWLQSPAGGTQP